jgi:hypothetical protein
MDLNHEEDSYLQHRDFESVIRGIDEDWECAQSIQQGLLNCNNNADAAREEGVIFTYGCFEGNNVAFLEHVDWISKELLD